MIHNENKGKHKGKRKAYLQYINNRTTQKYDEYRRIGNRVNARVRELKTEYWANFTQDIERDLYRNQKRI